MPVIVAARLLTLVVSEEVPLPTMVSVLPTTVPVGETNPAGARSRMFPALPPLAALIQPAPSMLPAERLSVTSPPLVVTLPSPIDRLFVSLIVRLEF